MALNKKKRDTVEEESGVGEGLEVGNVNGIQRKNSWVNFSIFN